MNKHRFRLLSGIFLIQALFLFTGCSVEEPQSEETAASSSNSTSSDNSSSDNSSTGSSNIGPQKVYIVGYAVTEKCIYYDCPKSKVVLWDLGGNMTVLDDSCGPADATSHNDSIYIAGNTQYCVVGPDKKVVSHELNVPSGYVENSQESTGIAVSSNGDVYVSGKATKNKKSVAAYWKNGELIKSFSEKSISLKISAR